jgi:threonine synthase
MKLYNLKDHNEQVSFAQAVTQGLGKNQGLFFPHDLPEFSLTEIDEMLKLDFVTRSQIAEVTARHRDNQLVARFLRQLRNSFKVVANLRQQTADVNGVSRV